MKTKALKQAIRQVNLYREDIDDTGKVTLVPDGIKFQVFVTDRYLEEGYWEDIKTIDKVIKSKRQQFTIDFD